MNVIDATNKDLALFSKDVIKHLDINSFEQILVVGVASGGVPIAKIVSQQLGNNATYFEVKCQRPSTKTKEQGLFSKVFDLIIKVSPKFILNILRNIEHIMLSKKRPPERVVIPVVPLNTEVPFDCILIIDDAVDSGYSLEKVVNFFKAKANIPLFSAVYVTTQKDPVFKADFSYKNNVLVRFPWSKDA